QEILILVVTKLSTFKGDSKFHTWVYRVATNYLLTAKKILSRDLGLTFEMFAADLEAGLVADSVPDVEETILLNELRIACTSAMLLCLDGKHRVAYVLGDILELDHVEAAEVLGISKDNFRKRLSRARGRVVEFTQANCGLANSAAKCSCKRRLPAAVEMGRVSSSHLQYATEDAPSYAATAIDVEKTVGDLKVLKLQTATSSFRCPDDLAAAIEKIVQA
ncbi:MAG: RNA polymerase sigma factor, partial [Kordiimonas sp.]